jgi:formylglycine-generating enzyme required for sulfatase activity
MIRDRIDGSSGMVLLDLTSFDCEIWFSGGRFIPDTGKANHPIRTVNWYGAAAYCDWLSLQKGLPRAYNHSGWQCNGNAPYQAQGYRLPTEAEWEYACRAGSTTAFANGQITEILCGLDPVLDAIGWYCGNSNNWSRVVADRIPNAWGLYDMHGNLSEWCNDLDGIYSGDITDPVGASSGSYRVFRGGSYGSGAKHCRSAKRHSYIPYSFDYTRGFRLVRSAGL